jgi:hypothetical protein
MPITQILVEVEIGKFSPRIIQEMVVVYVKVGRVDRATRMLREARVWGYL